MISMDNKKSSALFLSLTILFASTIIVMYVPHAHAANQNLFVSAENSKFNNYFAGPQVIEVIVSDPNIDQTNQLYGEPTVTVNGKRLRMAQAIDGNWYGFFADSKQAQMASATEIISGMPTGKGLSFGQFCSPSTAINATGVGFSDTKGIAIAKSAPADIQSFGSSSPSATVTSQCTGLSNGDIAGLVSGSTTLNHVVRQSKALNLMSGISGGKPGQIGIAPNAWPVIQLYDFATPASVVVDYQRSGGDQIVNLTFDRIPANIIGSPSVFHVNTNSTLTSANSTGQVSFSINDQQLNIDPTDVDSWTWGTRLSNNTLYYEAFDNAGNPDSDGTIAMQNLVGNLTNLMFNHNGKLIVNLAVQGTPVAQFVANDLQQLDQSGRTYSISANDGPMTLAETGTNTGTFKNYDEVNMADLNILPDPVHALAGKQLAITYNNQSQTVTVSNSDPTYVETILSDLTQAKGYVFSNKLMDAADKLLDATSLLNNISDPQKRSILSSMIYNLIYSDLIGATPAGPHEYPLKCQPHYVQATTSPSVGQISFSYSNKTSLSYYPYATTSHTENSVCLPYLIRGSSVSSADFNETAHTLTIKLQQLQSPLVRQGFLILPIDRSLLDAKDSSGHDIAFTSFTDSIQSNHQENNTATVRVLTVAFPSTASQISIGTATSQCISNAGPSRTVGPSMQVTLDGSASTCNTYHWSQISGTPVTLLFANTAHPVFFSPNVASGQKIILKFQLAASNLGGPSSTVTITVTNQPITVTTDKSLYHIGDVVVISGTVNPVHVGTPVTLKIISPVSNIIDIDQLTVNNGDFTKSFNTNSSLLAANGTYTVQVQYGDRGIQASTTFIMAPSSVGKQWSMGISKDDSTIVNMATSTVLSGQPLYLALSFTNAQSQAEKIQQQNYEIIIKQDGNVIWDKNSYAVMGDDLIKTNVLKSSSPVDIAIKLLGQGDPTADQSTWTGPKDDSIESLAVVPEFGPLVLSMLAIGFASIVLFARFGQRSKF